MDAGLSFIMANHARVKPYDLVYDPFVGTGEKVIYSALFIPHMLGCLIRRGPCIICKAEHGKNEWMRFIYLLRLFIFLHHNLLLANYT